MTSSEESCAAAAAVAASGGEEEEKNVQENPEPIYVTLNSEQPTTEVESLCMNCFKQGITRLMFLQVC